MRGRASIISAISKGSYPHLLSATVQDLSPNDVVMVFSEAITGTNLGFSLSGTTDSSFVSISGSGTTTITGTLTNAVIAGETVLLSYDDTTGDLQDGDSNPILTFSNFAVINNVSVYTDMFGAYSLRNVYGNWTNGVIRLRRISDSAQADVYFDGDTITLNSLVSVGGTLSDWIGSGDATVVTWYLQTPDNSIIANSTVTRSTASEQPDFIVSGSILTKDGLPALYFDGTDQLIKPSTAFTLFNNGNAFTVFTISANESANTLKGIMTLDTVSANNVRLVNDRRTNKQLFNVYDGANTVVDALAQDDTSNRKLLSFLVDGSKNIEAWKDGTSQGTNSYTGTYTNGMLSVGNTSTNTNRMIGYIQEIIIFDSDKSADMALIHSNINSYYSIY